MKNRYHVVDILKEPNPLFQDNPTLGEFVFIAIIKDAQQEQPFRVLIENFDSLEEAQQEIADWIFEREREDEQREVEAGRGEKNKQSDETLSKLKEVFLP